MKYLLLLVTLLIAVSTRVCAQSAWDDRFAIPQFTEPINSIVESTTGDPIIAGSFLYAGKQRANGLARWDGTSWTTVPGWNERVALHAWSIGDSLWVLSGYPSRLRRFVDGEAMTIVDTPSRIAHIDVMPGMVAYNLNPWPYSGRDTIVVIQNLKCDSIYPPNTPDAWCRLDALKLHGDSLVIAQVFGDTVSKVEFTSLRCYSFVTKQWSMLGPNDTLAGIVNALCFDASGHLYAGGSFVSLGGVGTKNVSVWRDSTWSPVGTWRDIVEGTVQQMTPVQDSIVMVGNFTKVGRDTAHSVLLWTGKIWSRDLDFVPAYSYYTRVAHLRSGWYCSRPDLSQTFKLDRFDTSWNQFDQGSYQGILGQVTQLVPYHNDVYVAGFFTTQDGQAIHNLAHWDGERWHSMGLGPQDTVGAVVATDSGVFLQLLRSYPSDSLRMGGWWKWDGNSWMRQTFEANNNYYGVERSDGTVVMSAGSYVSTESELELRCRKADTSYWLFGPQGSETFRFTQPQIVISSSGQTYVIAQPDDRMLSHLYKVNARHSGLSEVMDVPTGNPFLVSDHRLLTVGNDTIGDANLSTKKYTIIRTAQAEWIQSIGAIGNHFYVYGYSSSGGSPRGPFVVYHDGVWDDLPEAGFGYVESYGGMLASGATDVFFAGPFTTAGPWYSPNFAILHTDRLSVPVEERATTSEPALPIRYSSQRELTVDIPVPGLLRVSAYDELGRPLALLYNSMADAGPLRLGIPQSLRGFVIFRATMNVGAGSTKLFLE